MIPTKLQDDLFRDFKDQKKMIYEQVELLDPLGTSLRKPAAQRLISKGILIGSEILCYLFSIGLIVFLFFTDKIYPFYILSELLNKTEYHKLGWLNIQAFVAIFYGMVILMAILFYCIARAARAIRLKNDILNLAGKNIKEIVGQHLKRKAAIDAIEQRHFIELPNEHLQEGIVKPGEIPNPGY